MSHFRYPGRTVFLVALALTVGGAAVMAQPRPGQIPPGPGGPGGPPGRGGPPPMAPPKPYKPVAVTLPQPYNDPSFEAFRKELGDHREPIRTARLSPARWSPTASSGWAKKGDKANKRKSGIDNLVAAIGLDHGGEGWELLTSAANEATLESIPDKKGVMCSPAGPNYRPKAAEQTAKATGTSPQDWAFRSRAGSTCMRPARPAHRWSRRSVRSSSVSCRKGRRPAPAATGLRRSPGRLSFGS